MHLNKQKLKYLKTKIKKKIWNWEEWGAQKEGSGRNYEKKWGPNYNHNALYEQITKELRSVFKEESRD